ncbi:hypothetical protein AB0C52_24070 [Streptomyces sp. NPDC048717]|uniref:hypothetical protein n=1 Tax=Streptomyces sp. NPDC048717 TaxID=3154928 RepID=UPI0034260296
MGAHAGAGTSAPIKDGEQTTTPPVHETCAEQAAELWPHLLRGAVAARVREVVQWGVRGTLHFPAAALDAVPAIRGVQVAYGEPDIARILADQAVAELRGVTPVVLRPGAGAR